MSSIWFTSGWGVGIQITSLPDWPIGRPGARFVELRPGRAEQEYQAQRGGKQVCLPHRVHPTMLGDRPWERHAGWTTPPLPALPACGRQCGGLPGG